MNKERILELASHIENSETYNQTRIDHLCGTPACIAGHAYQLYNSNGRYCGRFADILDLPDMEMDAELTRAHPLFGYIPSAKDAAAVLRNLAETGEVDWTIRLRNIIPEFNQETNNE